MFRINHATAQRDVLVCLIVPCNSDLTFHLRLHSHRPRDPLAITDRNGKKTNILPSVNMVAASCCEINCNSGPSSHWLLVKRLHSATTWQVIAEGSYMNLAAIFTVLFQISLKPNYKYRWESISQVFADKSALSIQTIGKANPINRFWVQRSLQDGSENVTSRVYVPQIG